MMNEEYIKRLDFDSDTFEAMKTDINFILQRMIGSMIEKDSTEGSMTIKIDVNMVTEWIPNNNPDVEGETRMIRKPQFKYKCASTIKINDEKSGSFNNEMELDMSENGCYYLKPVADTTQRTIFDSDFQSGMISRNLTKKMTAASLTVLSKNFRETARQHFLAMMIREVRTRATLRQRISRSVAPRTHQIAQKRTKTVQIIFLPQTRITTLKSTLPKLCSVLTERAKRIQTSQATITVMMTQRRNSQCLECQVT